MNKLYAELALLVNAIEGCKRNGNEEWRRKHEARAHKLVKEYMPSGSGFDTGTQLDISCSTTNELIFTVGFHHMNPEGFYDGWTSHSVTVKPSLAFGIEIKVGGRDRNDIKDYIHEAFHSCLVREVPHPIPQEA